MKQEDRERLIRVETKQDFICDNMAYKSSISLLKWAIGGVGTIALSSLLLAAKGVWLN